MYTEKMQVARGIFHGIPLESVALFACIIYAAEKHTFVEECRAAY